MIRRGDNGLMLSERPIDFTHGYRMRCENCDASNWLTAEEHAGTPDAMMTCSSCQEEFLPISYEAPALER